MEILPLPGSDDSIAVSQVNDVSPSGLVAIYDSGTKRPNTTRDWAYDSPESSSCLVGSAQISPDGSTLWGIDTDGTPSCVSAWQINASGLTQTATGAALPRAQGAIVCQQGFCFTDSGSVLNATSLQLVGSFGQFGASVLGAAGRVLPDLDSKRVFYIDDVGSLRTFAFDPANPAPSQTPILAYTIPDFNEGEYLVGFFKWNDELVIATNTELIMVPISIATS